MPSGKPIVQLKHSHHSTFLQSNNQIEQQGIFVQSARNRSPSCSSQATRSRGFLEKNPRLNKSESMVKQGFFKIISRTLLLVLLYYLSSIGLTFYQKWLMRVIAEHFLIIVFERLIYVYQ